jgi:anaphase-promoting complex subunit 10
MSRRRRAPSDDLGPPLPRDGMDEEDHDDVVVEAEEEDHDDDEEEEEDDQGETRAGPNTSRTASAEPVLLIHAVSNLDSLYGLREIGREALCWQLASAKPGNGVEQIRDQSTDTYWQSDGVSQPHWIQVHFARRVAISHVCFYLDYNLDESYTPKHVSVQVGMTTQDLVPAIYPANTVVEFQEPVGWCIIPLTAPPDPLDDDDELDPGGHSSRRPVRTHLIQISIISMHQNGRDTHVRQVQLYGPRTAAMMPSIQKEADNSDMITSHAKRRNFDEEFSTVAMSQYSTIR